MISTGVTKRFGLLAIAAAAAMAPTSTRAQEQGGGEQWAKWWYGVYGGANYNLFSGALSQLPAGDSTVGQPGGFDKGNGLGLALGGILEYNPGGLVGFNVMIGYDNRAVKFDAKPGPNSLTGATNEQLSTGLAYFALEPNIRINLGNRFFHALLGVNFDINVAKGYTYTADAAGATTTHSGDLANPRSFVIGGHAGLGYDIPLNGADASTQMLLTPFAQVHLGQDLLDVPDGNPNKFSVTTVRAGVELKFGSRPTPVTPRGEVPAPTAEFTVRPPEVVTESRRLNETFPVRNYIFFDAGSTEIPSRYKRLSPSDAGSFKEEQLLTPGAQTGSTDAMAVRSRRQMEVYYNVMNVFGDRLRRNPSATIRLIGSGNGNAATGKTMAENVKNYLVSTFGIDGSRITTEGRDLPLHKSGDVSSRGEDKKLIDAENNRVEIVANPPEILAPINIVSIQEEPIDNDIVFTVPSSTDMASWNLEITERGGATHSYGPYSGTNVARIDSKELLGARRESRYTSRVMIAEKDGRIDTAAEKEFRLVRADASEEQTGTRYSILFEFDDSKTVETYEQFLVKTVAPNIPSGSSVIIHGHTDVTGDPEYNAKLSQRRAEETQKILTRELTNAGKTVTFDTYGFGEDERRSPFNNVLPEQRYYNRTVVIEVVPGH